MNRLVDPSLKTGSHVWNKFDDRDGPLNLNDVLDEFRGNIYGLTFIALYGGISKFNMGLVMFDWAWHVTSSIEEAHNKPCIRTFKDNNLFPWDVCQVPVYQEFQFSSSENLSKLLLDVTDDKNERMDYCKSFMAALLWRYFPHCCGFTIPRGCVTFGKGKMYPYVRIMSKCENPVCQLSVTLLIPTLPVDGNEPVKFALFVNRNRRCAFQSWWYPYAESSFVMMAQQIGDSCPHCIVDGHVTKLPPDNFTLESLRHFANTCFIYSNILSLRDKEDIALLDLFCYIESEAMASGRLNRNVYKKCILKGKQKEAFIDDKAKIHEIMGTSALHRNVVLHDDFDDIQVAPQAETTIWGFPGQLNPESIIWATKRALECGLVGCDDDVSSISESLSKNISYLHLLPSLQQYLKAVPSVHGFLKLVPSDIEARPVFSCSQCDQAFTSDEFPNSNMNIKK